MKIEIVNKISIKVVAKKASWQYKRIQIVEAKNEVSNIRSKKLIAKFFLSR